MTEPLINGRIKSMIFKAVLGFFRHYKTLSGLSGVVDSNITVFGVFFVLDSAGRRLNFYSAWWDFPNSCLFGASVVCMVSLTP